MQFKRVMVLQRYDLVNLTDVNEITVANFPSYLGALINNVDRIEYEGGGNVVLFDSGRFNFFSERESETLKNVMKLNY